MNFRSAEELRSLLGRIDGNGYKAYKEIKGLWRLPDLRLHVDHVQGDPFAFPSRVRVTLEPDFTGLPREVCRPGSRAVGTAALLARTFGRESHRIPTGGGTGKSGEIHMEAPGQEVLEQTAVRVAEDGSVEARFTVGLPARGRRILAKEAIRLLLEKVPDLVARSFRAEAYPPEQILRHAQANEDADALRARLTDLGLVAFVADGSILPRASGVSQEPLAGDGVVPFRSPPELLVQMDLPNVGPVRGMGIPEGVTLIVGGGYHGKSTLLRALERGVYNHRPDDGRELVATHPAAVKIRAEDGRSVSNVDISPFIQNLPNGEDTRAFSSLNASGSTSQATNIMEALELGARVLLVDEDTAASNFMIRDRRMQALIPSEMEPITPFLDRIGELFETRGVSTVLVLGGSGDYLDVAHRVIAMKAFLPEDVTPEARRIAHDLATGRTPEVCVPWTVAPVRKPKPGSMDPRSGRKQEYLRVVGANTLVMGEQEIDLSSVEQIVSRAQLNALGKGLLLAWRDHMDGDRTLLDILVSLEDRMDTHGLDVLDPELPGNLARFRRFELGAVVNRIRSLVC